MHDHSNIGGAILFHSCYQSVGCKIGKSCFSTDTAWIINVTLRCKHRVMCVHNTLVTGHVRWLYRIIRITEHASEIFILQAFPEDQCHVFGRGIVIFIRESAGISKMCIGTSNFSSTLIHHINKILLCPAYMFSNLGSCIIRYDHQCMQTVLHSHDLAYL